MSDSRSMILYRGEITVGQAKREGTLNTVHSIISGRFSILV